ncbi:MAG: hypothetical protein JXR84_13715 [Anaerolineae bacterium]|nr:hypothetical protein [Anaerolineae bacterium]
MASETQLWMWFLFNAGLAPLRAKTLLAMWDQRGLTLRAVLEALPAQAKALGLTPEEATKLHPPRELPDVSALRWNETLYPLGLQQLPFKLRPALLFYTGELSLLMHPMIYLAPGLLDAETHELLQETVGILLGENLLLAAFRESLQAALLLEEMIASEGEALLFAKQGLEQLTLPEQEQTLLQDERLLVLSPLPPTTLPNPAWDDVLEQVAAAAAMRRVYSGPAALDKTEAGTNALANALLLAASPGTNAPQGIRVVTNAAEAALWLTELPTAPVSPTQQAAAMPSPELAAAPLADSPPSPTEALRILEKGGRVPEALKKRLFGN